MEFFKLVRAGIGTAKRVLLAQVRGLGSTGDDDAAESVDNVEIVQPLGLYANPSITSQTEALCYRDGDEVVCIAMLDKGGAKMDPPAGTTILYSNAEPTCRVTLSTAGQVTVKPKTGQIVDLGDGATKGVARQTDPVSVGSIVIADGGGTVAVTVTNGSGVTCGFSFLGATIPPGTTITIPMTGTITGSSATVKAVD